jgi:hypothetical protein
MNGKISLHTFNLNNKRFTQQADPKECTKLFNQRILYETAIPLPAEAGSLLAAGRRGCDIQHTEPVQRETDAQL